MLAKADVETCERQNDKTGRGHPMRESLESGKPHQIDARATGFDANLAANKIENNQQQKHAKDRDRPDPAQPYFMELPPPTAHRLFQHIGFDVGNGAEALDAVG